MIRKHLAAIILSCTLLVAVGWATFNAVASTSTDLASFVPQGALLTIESPDFASLLSQWQKSPEEASWLKSDDYGVFSRSRLFANLQSAQNQFASAAGVPLDGTFLSEVAGKQSFFAWYDIGSLKIIYITRMTPAIAERSHLLQQRKRFQTRQAGGITFYVKQSSADDDGNSSDAKPSADNSQPDDSNSSADPSAENTAEASSDAATTATERPRTIAFAQSGEWLVLATDENLMAQTLELMAAKGTPSQNALSRQDWYGEARSVAPSTVGALRMILNMKQIVATPQFRSYWVQQNITEMKQYKSAVDDLYQEGDTIRDERILLPEADAQSANADLAPVTALLPENTVVYRASAFPSAADALASLQEKVLTRSGGNYQDPTAAPTADVTSPQPGDANDLETRIDDAQSLTPAATTKQPAPLLTAALQKASLQSMMTVDRNITDASTQTIWTHFASAVVLTSDHDWDLPAMQQAIQQALQQQLTVGDLGITWQTKSVNGIPYATTSEAHPMQLAVTGHLCILADDADLLADMLQKQRQTPASKPQQAMLLSGFDHEAARPAFLQWTAIVDKIDRTKQTSGDNRSPKFFGQDMESLSAAFARMKSESFNSRKDNNVVRQTATYVWKP